MRPALQTPSLDHLSRDDFKHVYEPAEDTFLLLDVLEAEQTYINGLRPLICMEIGSGSGCVISFLGRLLNHPSYLIATDVNPQAALATAHTAEKNNVRVDAVLTDLMSALQTRLRRAVDVLIFNPPYVPTEASEVGRRDLTAAWAGGVNGRQVLDRLLPHIGEILSPRGVFYLVAIRANKPIGEKQGFLTKLIAKRGAGNESLMILKIWRKNAPQT